MGESTQVLEGAGGGLGAGQGLDRRKGGSCSGIGYTLRRDWLAMGSKARDVELEMRSSGGRTVKRPSEMVPMNLQMVAVVRDMFATTEMLILLARLLSSEYADYDGI